MRIVDQSAEAQVDSGKLVVDGRHTGSGSGRRDCSARLFNNE